MRSRFMHTSWSLLAMVATGALLAGCGSRQPETPEPLQPAPADPQTTEQPEVAAQPDAAAATLADSKPARPAAGSEPELSGMKVAQVVSDKTGVPVELRYQLDGDAMAGQPVTLYLAAVPRVEGTNLSVSIKAEPGLEFPKETLNAQKAQVATAYRKQVRLTRLSGGPQELRVLVTMDFPIGQGFTWYTVPLAGSASSKPAVDRLQ
jgi:hypothetical protein